MAHFDASKYLYHARKAKLQPKFQLERPADGNTYCGVSMTVTSAESGGGEGYRSLVFSTIKWDYALRIIPTREVTTHDAQNTWRDE